MSTAADAQHVYWWDKGVLKRTGGTGHEAERIAEGLTFVERVLVDDKFVYAAGTLELPDSPVVSNAVVKIAK